MATGVVLIMPKTHKAMMTVQNLSTLPTGKVYRLWAVANGKKFDCGKFNANEKGQVIKCFLGGYGREFSDDLFTLRLFKKRLIPSLERQSEFPDKVKMSY
jgi:hypothetical protein